jgi:hypothetical protein
LEWRYCLWLKGIIFNTLEHKSMKFPDHTFQLLSFEDEHKFCVTL